MSDFLIEIQCKFLVPVTKIISFALNPRPPGRGEYPKVLLLPYTRRKVQDYEWKFNVAFEKFAFEV